MNRRRRIAPLARLLSIAFVATAGMAAMQPAVVAANGWPADGLQVMSTNGSVFLLPGGPDVIRVLAESRLCGDAPNLTTVNSGLAEGAVTTDGQLLAGNGRETLLFCEHFPLGIIPPSFTWINP